MEHRLYRVWCRYGLLSEAVSIDSLIPNHINTIDYLRVFRDETLTAQERLDPSDPDWESPLMGTVAGYKPITIKAAWAAELETWIKRTEDQSRQRKTATRTAAVAADTAIAATRADKRTALSLSTVTNQPASHSQPSSASSIALILSEKASYYRVQWTQPEGTQSVGWSARAGWTSTVTMQIWCERGGRHIQPQQQ